jgi:hypothetical protein
VLLLLLFDEELLFELLLLEELFVELLLEFDELLVLNRSLRKFPELLSVLRLDVFTFLGLV